MKLATVDIAIVAVYLAAMALIGFWLKARATKGLDAFFLAGRGLPWWMLGLSGCSSYIDITGTMAMVGILYYLGLKGLWATHLIWGWFIICFYMAFQAKWIRRSGVMTFAEWNQFRFGPGRETEGSSWSRTSPTPPSEWGSSARRCSGSNAGRRSQRSTQ